MFFYSHLHSCYTRRKYSQLQKYVYSKLTYMDRRGFLTRATKKTRVNRETPYGERSVTSGVAPYTGSWTNNEVIHLMKRTMFGAAPADVAYFLTRSTSDAVDELLNYTPVLPPVRDYGLIDVEGVLYDDLGVPQGQTWINDPNTASDPEAIGSINNLRIKALIKWWAGLIINQNRSITEKMVLFWHHHFSVQRENVGDFRFLYMHHNLLRVNALGNVKQLVRDVCIDPAMLFHLNGYLNSKRAPDENFARELQELMTVGKSSVQGYSESDVIEAARVLTGWRINVTPVAGAYLEASEHDMGAKTFSSFYNNTVIAGSSNGTEEVDALVNMIFNADETARFICRKIYRWFVYYDIDETIETNVITPMATTFKAANFNIKPALSLLLKSEHFFDVQNQVCSIKSPFDFIVGAIRELNIPFPPVTDYQNGYPKFEVVYQEAARMQQTLFEPPDVSGWPSYYQDPMFYELWVHSNSLPKRAAYTNNLINSGVVDVRAIVNNTSNPALPDNLINDITALLLRYPLSIASKNYTKNRFLTNNGADSAWTTIWNSGNNTIINNSLKELFLFLMNLPEYHLHFIVPEILK
jgi:uncharacterized protein (DUF1800 family)